MFFKCAKCDRCGAVSPASEHATVRIRYKSRENGKQRFFDLCEHCLNGITADITVFGDDVPDDSEED